MRASGPPAGFPLKDSILWKDFRDLLRVLTCCSARSSPCGTPACAATWLVLSAAEASAASATTLAALLLLWPPMLPVPLGLVLPPLLPLLTLPLMLFVLLMMFRNEVLGLRAPGLPGGEVRKLDLPVQQSRRGG